MPETTEFDPQKKQRTLRTVAASAFVAVAVPVLQVINAAVQGGIEKVNWSVTAASLGTAASVALTSWALQYLSPAKPPSDD